LKKNLFILYIVFAAIICPQTADKSRTIINLKSLHQQFSAVLQSPLKYAEADSIIIKKPNAVFTLKSGNIFVCPLINDEIHALLFTGDGNFSFTPTDEIERMQLYRFYNKETLDENFAFLFLLFNDETLNNIKDQLVYSESEDNSIYKRQIKEVFDYIFDDDDGFLYRDIAYIFLEGKDSSLFYSHFNDNDGNPMFYEINPMYEEELRLMRKYNNPFTKKHEVICQFSSEPDKSFSEKKKYLVNGEINISKHLIECEIESDLDFSSNAKLIFNPKFEDQKWIVLNLYPDLEIDSLFLNDRRIKYYVSDESYNVFVECDEPLKKSGSYTLDFYYHGDLFERDDLGWISFKSPNLWFPRCSNWEKSLFDLTFHVSEKFKFCSVGSEMLREDNDDFITYKYTTKSPVKNVSFNLGNYDEYKIEEENLPPITVYISEYYQKVIWKKKLGLML
jgi:hypothetical protein